jgi:hypothetical protein
MATQQTSTGHESFDTRQEFASFMQDIKDGYSIEQASRRLAANLWYAQAELRDKLASIHFQYTIEQNEFCIGGQTMRQLLTPDRASVSGIQALDRDLTTRFLALQEVFLKEPGIAQGFVESRDIGFGRSYIYEFKRDPHNPAKIHVFAHEHIGTVQELAQFYSLLTGAKVTVGNDGSLAFPNSYRDASNLVSREALLDAAINSYSSARKNDSAVRDYLSRFELALRDESFEKERKIEELAKVLMATFAAQRDLTQALKMIMAEADKALNLTNSGVHGLQAALASSVASSLSLAHSAVYTNDKATAQSATQSATRHGSPERAPEKHQSEAWFTSLIQRALQGAQQLSRGAEMHLRLTNQIHLLPMMPQLHSAGGAAGAALHALPVPRMQHHITTRAEPLARAQIGGNEARGSRNALQQLQGSTYAPKEIPAFRAQLRENIQSVAPTAQREATLTQNVVTSRIQLMWRLLQQKISSLVSLPLVRKMREILLSQKTSVKASPEKGSLKKLSLSQSARTLVSRIRQTASKIQSTVQQIRRNIISLLTRVRYAQLRAYTHRVVSNLLRTIIKNLKPIVRWLPTQLAARVALKVSTVMQRIARTIYRLRRSIAARLRATLIKRRRAKRKNTPYTKILEFLYFLAMLAMRNRVAQPAKVHAHWIVPVGDDDEGEEEPESAVEGLNDSLKL